MRHNILKIAGSPLGYRHSEAAKKLISMANKNRKVSESSRDLKREALLGKSFERERIENMLSNTFRRPVLLTNTETGNIKEFFSMTDAGVYLSISRVTVRKYLLSGLPYKGYIITEAPLKHFSKDTDKIDLPTSQTTQPQPVLVTNQITGISKQFYTEAAEYMQVSRGRLWYFLKKANTDNETLNGYKITKLVLGGGVRGTRTPLQNQEQASSKLRGAKTCRMRARPSPPFATRWLSL